MADAEVRKAIAGMSPKVTLGVDTAAFATKITALQTQAAALAKQLDSMRANPDTTAFDAKVAGLQAKLVALGKQMSALQMKADTSKLDAQIVAELAKLATLSRQASNLQMDADAKALTAKIATLNAQIAAMYKKLESGKADVDISLLQKKIEAAEAQVALLNSSEKKGELDASTAKINAAIAATIAKISQLKTEARDIQLGANIDTGKLVAYEAQLLGIQAAMEKLSAAEQDTTGKTGLLATAWAGLNERFKITPSWLAPTMAGFSGLHILLDALVEAVIVASTVMLALGAAAAVAYPAIDQVGYATKNSLNAMTALGVDAGPLAGKLDAVQKAMAPRVIEAYGGALSLLTGQTGALSRAGTQVVTMFDDWIAKLDLWAVGQKDMGGLLKTGEQYLGQLVRILGTLGQALDNMLQKDPGIAKFLLDIIQGAASLINLFSRLPAPIVEATLALHGLYLWGSLLVGVFLRIYAQAESMGLGIARVAGPMLGLTSATETLAAEGEKAAVSTKFLAGSFLGLSGVSWAWIAVVVAALGYYIYNALQADKATKALTSSLDQQLGQMSASQAATTGLAAGIGQIETRITALNATSRGALSQMGTGWHQVQSGVVNLFTALAAGNPFDVLKAEARGWGTFVTGILHGLGVPAQQNAADINMLNDELNKLVGQQKNLYEETGSLIKQGYTFQQSLALMDAAGVKAGDSFALMQQKVTNLIRGYQDMSVGAGILANSINALNFQTEQQDSKVTQLNDAWDTFFKTVTGGATGFNSFATDAIGLYASLGDASSKMTVSNGKANISLQATTAAGAGTAVSMRGLNTASLQARDSFLQTASAANTQIDNLTLLASAAGLGSKGTDMLTSATKDMVAQMLPAAKGSQEMTDVLYALAQHGGYQGADSFQALAKWVGNTRDPMESLDKITGTLTHDAANLTTDVKNLSVALGQNLNGAMAAAILQASGGQKVFDTFADAVLKTGANSHATQQAAVPLEQAMLRLTGNAKDAKSEFETFAQEGLGMTRAQADKLWQETFPKAQQSMKDTAAQAGKSNSDMKTSTKQAQDQMGLWQHIWTNVSNWGKDAWHPVENAAKVAFGGIEGAWAHVWSALVSPVTHAFDDVKRAITSGFDGWWRTHGDQVKAVWAAVCTYVSSRWAETFGGLRVIGNAFAGAWSYITGILTSDWRHFTNGVVQDWDLAVRILRRAWTDLTGWFANAAPIRKAITGAFQGVYAAVLPIFQTMGSAFVGTFKTGADLVAAVFRILFNNLIASLKVIWDTAVVIISVALDLITGHWGRAWADMKNYAIQVWHALNTEADKDWGIIEKLGLQTWNNIFMPFLRLGQSSWDSFAKWAAESWKSTYDSFKSSLLSPLTSFFTKTFPSWLNDIGRFFKNLWITAWHDFYNQDVNPWTTLFTKTFPGWLDATGRFFKNLWITVWHDFYNDDIAPWTTLFTKTFPGWLSAVGRFFSNLWATAWQDFYNRDIAPWSTLFTRTFPGWLDGLGRKFTSLWDYVRTYFSDHVSKPISDAIGSWANDITAAFKAGWNSVAGWFNNNVINWINNNILHHLPGNLSVGHIPTFGGGGMVHHGAGPTADDVLARVSRGELVVPAHMVAAGAVDHLRGRLPGFAAGGMVDPVGAWARPERIDMGVDYGGAGPLYAISHGTITNLYNSGWPGGTFIGLRMDQGSKAGSYWYYAEDIAPLTQIGATVNAGQHIANATGGPSGIEIGFAAPPGSGMTMAAATGEQNAHGDPGAVSTGWGKAASDLIASLGGPAGIVQGKVAGGTPGIAGGFAQIWQNVEGLLDAAGTGLGSLISPIAGFIQGGSKELLSLAQQGAKAIFDFVWSHTVSPLLKTLPGDQIPGAIIQDVAAEIKTGIDGFLGQQDSSAQQSAQSASGGVYLGPGGGNYTKMIQTVLSSLHLPLSLTANWLRQIQTESGGNLNAVNTTDINAQLGHPSVGLLQLIPATFAAYAGPYLHTPPLVNKGGGPVSEDPMAQIYAAIHYADSVYHGAAMDQIIGRGHGYDSGGLLPPGVSVAVNNTGKPEMVTPMGGGGGPMSESTGQAICARLDRLISLASTAPATYAQALSGVASRSASRGFYGG